MTLELPPYLGQNQPGGKRRKGNVDSPANKLTDILTQDRAYLRMHGRWRWYADDYSPSELDEITGLARSLADRGASQIYIFFNNDIGGDAPANALTLLDKLRA